MIDFFCGLFTRIAAIFYIIFFFIMIILNLILCIFLPVGWIMQLFNKLLDILSRDFKANAFVIFVLMNIYIAFRCLTGGTIAPGVLDRIFSLEMLKWEGIFFAISYITGFLLGFGSYFLLKRTDKWATKILDRKDILAEYFHCLLNAFDDLLHG